MKTAKKLLSILFIGALAASASAADYYVALDGTYEGAPDGATVYTSLDEAITAAGNAADVIHVEPGTYSTTTQYGPNLAAKLIGTGTSRDKVVIQSAGTYRTLRMAAGAWLENVTVIGNTDITKVDKGGAIEMSGGTVTNCVVRDGTAKGNDSHNAGGNVYSSSTESLIVDCVISGGTAQRRGGNVCLDQGTLRNCTITGGSTSGGSQQNNGGNVWTYQGKIENCTISGGSAEQGGNVYIHNSVASVSGGTISDGTATQGGNLYVNAGAVSGSTISDGTATQGGNLYVKVGTIRGLTCEDGNATGNGGNIYMEGAATIVEGAIRRGTATSKGGNVYMGDGMLQDLEISGGVLTGNVREGEGGGNIFWNNGRISRCSITGGKLTGTTSLHGGGINCVYTTNDNVTRLLEDCLLAENENAAIFCNRSFATYNCSFINNAGASVNSWNPITLDFANCVIFGNTNSTGVTHAWTGNRPVIKNVATDDTSLSNTDGYVAITASAFADYANGDYRPAADGALVDAGADDERADASTKDLDGNPRLSDSIDIGCYEYQKTTMSVDIALASSAETYFAPASVTFNITASGYPAGQTPTFTVNFGDGTDEVETTDTEVVHEYAKSGKFTVTVKASAAGAFNAEKTVSDLVLVGSKTIYVKSGNESAAFPYDTPETGYANIADAVSAAAEGHEIRLLPGVHEVRGQLSIGGFTVHGVSATAEETVRPEDVIVRNVVTELDGYKYRVMEVTNAAARVANLTIENGRVVNQDGGNLRLAAGIVSNCVIRGGLVRRVGDGDKDINAAGGGAEIGQGTLTHCVVSNNVVEGTSSKKYFAGGAVYFTYGQKGGHVSNCLVAYNSYKPDSDAYGSAGIQYGGDNNNSSIENCTVVSNVVVGTLNGDSAGISCTTWYGRLRNNIVLGNYETGKGKFTAVVMDTQHGTYVNNLTDGDVNQVFRDFEHGDFGLRVSCAAYNKGTTSGLYLTPSVDLAGNTRVKFNAIDIGCYECQIPAGLMILLQ